MDIRNMEIEDYEEVYDLWIHTPGMGLNDVDDSRQGIERYLKRNPASCFVAVEDGQIIGVILSGHDGRRGYIHHTAVREAYRGRGIGAQLVDRAVCALEAEGITKIALVAFAVNRDGNAFWEKMGFHAREDLIYRDKETKNAGIQI